jgi:hypothetical protein
VAGRAYPQSLPLTWIASVGMIQPLPQGAHKGRGGREYVGLEVMLDRRVLLPPQLRRLLNPIEPLQRQDRVR